MTKDVSRLSFVAGAAAAITLPSIASASAADDKKRFIAQCDESISIDRLIGAPYKFVGKKVDIHGIVGPASDPSVISLDSPNDPSTFVVVIADSRQLESGQRIRVIGTVEKPYIGQNQTGGGGTYAVIRKAYIE